MSNISIFLLLAAGFVLGLAAIMAFIQQAIKTQPSKTFKEHIRQDPEIQARLTHFNRMCDQAANMNETNCTEPLLPTFNELPFQEQLRLTRQAQERINR